MSEQKPQLDEKDLQCMAWMIESSMHTGNPFGGCQYCDNSEACAKELFENCGMIHAHEVLLKLQRPSEEEKRKLAKDGNSLLEDRDVTLSYKDIYCITRNMQDHFYEHGYLFGCKCCRYSDECFRNWKDGGHLRIDDLRKRFGEITGLYTGIQHFDTSPQRLKMWLQGF